MATYSYYVDSGYWNDGYTEDITVNFVTGAAASAAVSTTLAAGGFTLTSGSAVATTATILTGANNVYLEGALSQAAVTVKAAGQNLLLASGKVTATGWVGGALELTRTYPGVNLNAKSSVLCGINIRAVSGGLVEASSSTKAGSRIFWENTTPASGAWTVIVPQAEGSGE